MSWMKIIRTIRTSGEDVIGTAKDKLVQAKGQLLKGPEDPAVGETAAPGGADSKSASGPGAQQKLSSPYSGGGKGPGKDERPVRTIDLDAELREQAAAGGLPPDAIKMLTPAAPPSNPQSGQRTPPGAPGTPAAGAPPAPGNWKGDVAGLEKRQHGENPESIQRIVQAETGDTMYDRRSSQVEFIQKRYSEWGPQISAAILTQCLMPGGIQRLITKLGRKSWNNDLFDHEELTRFLQEEGTVRFCEIMGMRVSPTTPVLGGAGASATPEAQAPGRAPGGAGAANAAKARAVAASAPTIKATPISGPAPANASMPAPAPTAVPAPSAASARPGRPASPAAGEAAPSHRQRGYEGIQPVKLDPGNSRFGAGANQPQQTPAKPPTREPDETGPLKALPGSMPVSAAAPPPATQQPAAATPASPEKPISPPAAFKAPSGIPLTGVPIARATLATPAQQPGTAADSLKSNALAPNLGGVTPRPPHFLPNPSLLIGEPIRTHSVSSGAAGGGAPGAAHNAAAVPPGSPAAGAIIPPSIGGSSGGGAADPAAAAPPVQPGVNPASTGGTSRGPAAPGLFRVTPSPSYQSTQELQKRPGRPAPALPGSTQPLHVPQSPARPAPAAASEALPNAAAGPADTAPAPASDDRLAGLPDGPPTASSQPQPGAANFLREFLEETSFGTPRPLRPKT